MDDPTENIRAEIDVLDAEMWELPSRMSSADCEAQTGAAGLFDPRNPDDPKEHDR